MSEIRKNFTGGKMNKDLDERFVRPGEYRDAMNIQVRATDGDAAGTVQNLRGNTEIGIGHNETWMSGSLSSADLNITQYSWPAISSQYPVCLASIADEKSDLAYFFFGMKDTIDETALHNTKRIFVDSIIEQTINGESTPVFVDKWAVCNTIQGFLSGMPDENFVNVQGTPYKTLSQGQGEVSSTVLSSFGNDYEFNDSYQIPVEENHDYKVGMKMYAYSYGASGNTTSLSTYEFLAGKNPEIKAIKKDSTGTYLLFDIPLNLSDLLSEVTHIVFKSDRILNFNPDSRRYITGVNIIDDLLFWTDNVSEPKKINIKRSKLGTDSSGTKQTQLMVKNPISKDYVLASTVSHDISVNDAYYNSSDDGWLINNDIREEHITVIRKAPKLAPTLDMKVSDRLGETTDIPISNYSFVSDDNMENVILEVGDIRRITRDVFEDTNFRKDDILIITYDFTTSFSPNIIDEDEQQIEDNAYNDTIKITAKFICYEDEGTGDETLSGPTKQIRISIINISGQNPTAENLNWFISLKQRKPLFSTKFVRFGYRYKYEDGEYSSFSPWSELAFLPGRLEYNTKKGYNLGMENDVRELIVRDFIPYDIPTDVKAVDILYKATDNANVYVAETIERGVSSEWELYTPNSDSTNIKTGELNIKSEMINRVLPETQLLRSWDNVPRIALSQEIVGNRLVYGNYYQGYDIPQSVGLLSEIESLNHSTNITGSKSIKSLRDYRIGMVFGDKYGRETPVITGGYTVSNTNATDNNLDDNTSVFGGLFVDKALAPKKNKIVVSQNWSDSLSAGSEAEPPNWLKDGYVKYFVKESSMEYYNIVLDRWYNSGDNNTVWLSFNSADRNKISEDTHLILKNRHMTDQPVTEMAKYKVLAIKNEAPDYIKRNPRTLGQLTYFNASSTKNVWNIDAMTAVGDQYGQQGSSFYGPPYGLFDVDAPWTSANVFDPYSMEIKGSTWNSSSIGNWAEIYSESESSEPAVGGEVFGRSIPVDSIVEFQIVGQQIDIEGEESVSASIESEWRELSHWSSTDFGVRLTWSKKFTATDNGGVDMYTLFDTNPGLVIASNFDSGDPFGNNLASAPKHLRYVVNFREVKIERRPEFEGKFFVKVEIDQELATNVLDMSVGEGAIWQTAASYNLSYIDSQHTNPAAMEMTNDVNDLPIDGFSNFGCGDGDGLTWADAFEDAYETLSDFYDSEFNCSGTNTYEAFFNNPWLVYDTGDVNNNFDYGYEAANIYQLIPPYYDDSPQYGGGGVYMPFVPLEFLYDPSSGDQLTNTETLANMSGTGSIDSWATISAEDSIWGVSGFVDITDSDYWFGGEQANANQIGSWTDPQPTGLQFIPGAGPMEAPNPYGAGVFGGTCGPDVWSQWNYATIKFWNNFHAWATATSTLDPAAVFIDAAGARQYVTSVEYSEGYPGTEYGNGYKYDFFKPIGLEVGQIANADGSFGTQDSLGRMNLAILFGHYYSVGGQGGEQGWAAGREFFDIMTTEGTVFRFGADPSRDLYKVVWVEPEAYVYTGQANAAGSQFTANFHEADLLSGGIGEDLSGSVVQLNGGGSATWLENNEANSDYVPLAGTWTGSADSIGTPGCPPAQQNSYDDSNVYSAFRLNRVIEFRKINLENGLIIQDTGLRVDSVFDPRSFMTHDGSTSIQVNIMRLGFGFKDGYDTNKVASNKGAIFETEPTQGANLDIYYEGSNAIPMMLNRNNIFDFAPHGCLVDIMRKSSKSFNKVQLSAADVRVNLAHFIGGYDADNNPYDRIIISLNKTLFWTDQPTTSLHKDNVTVGDTIIFKHKDGLETQSKVIGNVKPVAYINDTISSDEIVYGVTEHPVSFEEPDEINFQMFSGSTSFNSAVTVSSFPQQITRIVVNGVGGTSSESSVSYGWNWAGGSYELSPDNLLLLSQPNGFIYSQTQYYNYIFSQIELMYGGENYYSAAIEDIFANHIVDGGGSPVTYTGGGIKYNRFNFKIYYTERTGYYEIDPNVWKYPVKLGWHNCYSFFNGLESDRIRDDFNAPTIDNGVKVSSTFSGYGEENIGSGMIYSGLYNSTSQVNDTNEFNMSQKITKNLNPAYGSIQALKTRNTDLVVLTEDKVLKVIANKDAVYNADGNPQLVATNRVLGTAIPFSGDYGISKNPESLASDQFRMYFTDKQRGSVLRLSMDGLTPISSVGMKTWFRENLRSSDELLGTYDIVNGEYNLTLIGDYNRTVSFNEAGKGWVSFKSFIPSNGVSISGKYLTSHNNKIYEHYIPSKDKDGNCEQDICVDRNSFYGIETHPSSVTVLFNEKPEIVKSFETVSYEGSQAKITKFTGQADVEYAYQKTVDVDDKEFYNIVEKDGWFVSSMQTDIESGSLKEFVNKENKWFNSVVGAQHNETNIDTSSFTIQGLGQLTSYEAPGGGSGLIEPPDGSDDNEGTVEDWVGCTDPNATNYSSTATIDDGSCEYYACTDYRQIGIHILQDHPYYGDESNDIYGNYITANYNETAYLSDQEYICEGDELAFDINNVDPSTGLPITPSCCTYYACTDPNAINYIGDELAGEFENCDNSLAGFPAVADTFGLNVDTGISESIDFYFENGWDCEECFYDCGGGGILNATCGCNNPWYLEYYIGATIRYTVSTSGDLVENFYLGDPIIFTGYVESDISSNSYAIENEDGYFGYHLTQIRSVLNGTDDPMTIAQVGNLTDIQPPLIEGVGLPYNYGTGVYDNSSNPNGGCITQLIFGCTDPAALNYQSGANIRKTSPTDITDPCIFPVDGCMDPQAINYSPNATVDDGSCIYASDQTLTSAGWVNLQDD